MSKITNDRVNTPIGAHYKKVLKSEAKKAGTTETALARVLILDGIARLVSGQFTVQPTTIVAKGGN